MITTRGEINTFEELMDNVMWDWPTYDGPKIHKESNSLHRIAYTFNKTAIFEEIVDGHKRYILNYKLDWLLVSEVAFRKFEKFYDLLYDTNSVDFIKEE